MNYNNLYPLEILEEIERVRLDKNLPLDEKRKKLSLFELKELRSIPEDWLYVTSNEISEFITNGVHSPTSVEDDLGFGFRMLRITDIDDSGIASLDKLPYCKRFQKTDYNKFVKKNDIYISFTGNILGKRYFAKQDIENVVFAHYFVRLRPLVVDPRYIFYVMKSYHFEHFMRKRKLGSSQPNLKVIDLKRIPIPICSLYEQKAIANILSSFDDKIELNNKINKNLEKMAQALYKQWFVDFEFPHENGELYKSSGGEMIDSEIGLIPKKWEAKRIDTLTNVAIGKTPPRKEHVWFNDKKNENNVRWYSIKDMKDVSTQIYDSSEYLTLDAIQKHNVKVIPKNTILMSFKMTIGRLAVTTTECTSNEAIAHFINNESQVLNSYLFYYLKKFNYDSLGSTSSIATAINSKIVKSIKVLLPPMHVQEEFNNVVSTFMQKSNCNNIKNINLTDQRDTLLPKLMSGEIRVPIKE